MNQNYFEPNPCYDSNSFGFDQPPLYTIDHQEDLNQQTMNDVDDRWNKIIKLGNKIIQILGEMESTLPLNEINSQIPPSIVITTSSPVLPIEDPEDSLIMGNEELNTILKKESDEFIKSSVEDLVAIPSESEDTSEIDSECVLPSCDDFSPIDIPEEKAVSNPLFNSNDDFTSSDDESISDKDVLEENMSVAFILEGFTDEPPLEKNDDLFDLKSKNNEWKKILYDAPIDDLMTEDKVFDPGIHDQNFSPTYVSLPFTDRHYLFFTYVVQIFIPHFIYPVVSPFLISSGSEDTIFEPGISAFYFSHRGRTFICFNVNPNILNESLMENCYSTRFTLNITMIWGESS
nr:hypothetical protein [Tanacetum cinerariifolium]